MNTLLSFPFLFTFIMHRPHPTTAATQPNTKDMGEILLLNKFFSDCRYCLSCEDIARQSCAMVRRWRFFALFLRPVFPASPVQHISDLHSKFALGPCGSMVGIQSVAAEIRRGIKKIDRKIERNHRAKI